MLCVAPLTSAIYMAFAPRLRKCIFNRAWGMSAMMCCTPLSMGAALFICSGEAYIHDSIQARGVVEPCFYGLLVTYALLTCYVFRSSWQSRCMSKGGAVQSCVPD
eukprot:TRINITY_DN17212_c0_g1_i2.p1 TRINITY_DN17212_c0_g1~~TRINITY_DN17212_c0_g1_i2.p1  ORF type:complete len:105 (-),score=7.81 TRINITY_DN17212_c0_g1_i2:21-335(-)